MRIRRVDICNYRGIKKLNWIIPVDKKFICFIGPGDSTKSTILEAINLALSDRWNPSFADTDFHNADIRQPVDIRVTLVDLPDEIVHHDALGLELSGITAQGKLLHDQNDDVETCIVVRLQVDENLDLQWSVYREGDTEPGMPLGSGIRRKFRAFKVDERIDGHLRWTRTSALGRITENSDAAGTLAQATRASREAVTKSVSAEMKALTGKVRDRLQSLGSGGFSDLQPGLDTSLSASSGVLALFNGDVPLTNYGLGSRRLAGLAAQQLAYEDRTIVLIDEIEYGLEPHRLVHLLGVLRTGSDSAQVLASTHSPVAIEQLNISDLFVVRCADGVVEIHGLPDSDEDMQSLLRSRPSTFLARRIVLGEGKTEYGLLRTLVAHWDQQRRVTHDPPAAALGVALAHGDGGSQTAQRAKKLRDAKYDVEILVDSDDSKALSFIDDAERAGVGVVKWDGENCIETALAAVLGADDLKELVALATIHRPGAAVSVRDDLVAVHGTAIAGLDVGKWISDGLMDLDSVRALVGVTASQRGWFKSVTSGEALGEFVRDRLAVLSSTSFGLKLQDIERRVYAVGAVPTDE